MQGFQSFTNTTVEGPFLIFGRVAIKSKDTFSDTEYLLLGTIKTSQLVYEATPTPSHATILEVRPPLTPTVPTSGSTGSHPATFKTLTAFLKRSESAKAESRTVRIPFA